MHLGNPLALALLLVIPAVVGWWVKRRPATLRLPTFSWVPKLADRTRPWWSLTAFIAMLMGLASLIIALSDPKLTNRSRYENNNAVDIMMVLDASYSMNAEDFQPINRLEVAKDVIQRFITHRPADRIGVVIFGGNAYTQTPLTFDHDIAITQLEHIQVGAAGDGTAMGVAQGVAINRLLKSKAKTKLMILLTDGVNNQGELDPISAAQIAADAGIKIYTIGVGKPGGARFKVPGPNNKWVYARYPNGELVLSALDEATLRQIASLTGGHYFRATDANSLAAIYEQIDRSLKTKIKARITVSYVPLFPIFLGIGFSLIVMGLIIQDGLVRSRI